MKTGTSRPEGAFVLLLYQAVFWFAAGLSALPFALAGEVWMIVLGLASWLLALLAVGLGIALLWRRRRARLLAIGLEMACLVGAAIQLALPIGANRGPVAILVNLALPVAVVWLLWGKRMRAVFLNATVS
jgi:hypothetical protein